MQNRARRFAVEREFAPCADQVIGRPNEAKPTDNSRNRCGIGLTAGYGVIAMPNQRSGKYPYRGNRQGIYQRLTTDAEIACEFQSGRKCKSDGNTNPEQDDIVKQAVQTRCRLDRASGDTRRDQRKPMRNPAPCNKAGGQQNQYQRSIAGQCADTRSRCHRLGDLGINGAQAPPQISDRILPICRIERRWPQFQKPFRFPCPQIGVNFHDQAIGTIICLDRPQAWRLKVCELLVQSFPQFGNLSRLRVAFGRGRTERVDLRIQGRNARRIDVLGCKKLCAPGGQGLSSSPYE